MRSHDTSVVDANEKPLEKSFAHFKDFAFSSTTKVWCLLIREMNLAVRSGESETPPRIVTGESGKFLGIHPKCRS
jgi:hypothetical protein